MVLGDLQLPSAARLRLYRFNATTKPKQLVTLASVPKGYAGAVLTVKLDAQGYLAAAGRGNGTGERSGSGSRGGVLDFLEACMRAQFDGSDDVTFLSSGTEDCAVSAFALHSRQRQTSNSRH